jgi:hypothetical protein
MAEQHIRHRIVRRAVVALIVVVLLVSGYVGSYVAMWTLLSLGAIDVPAVDLLINTVYAPLEWYAANDMPGGVAISRFAHRFAAECGMAGARFHK